MKRVVRFLLAAAVATAPAARADDAADTNRVLEHFAEPYSGCVQFKTHACLCVSHGKVAAVVSYRYPVSKGEVVTTPRKSRYLPKPLLDAQERLVASEQSPEELRYHYHVMPDPLRGKRIPPYDAHLAKSAGVFGSDFIDTALLSREPHFSFLGGGEYPEMMAKLVADPLLCDRMNMAPGAGTGELVGAGSSPGMPEDPHPCLKDANGRWLPFAENPSHEALAVASAVTLLKGFRASCAFDGGRFYDFDRERDRVQWLGGPWADVPGAKCAATEQPYSFYRDAGFPSSGDGPFVGVHWKWFKGCKYSGEPDVSYVGGDCGEIVVGKECGAGTQL